MNLFFRSKPVSLKTMSFIIDGFLLVIIMLLFVKVNSDFHQKLIIQKELEQHRLIEGIDEIINNFIIHEVDRIELAIPFFKKVTNTPGKKKSLQNIVVSLQALYYVNSSGLVRNVYYHKNSESYIKNVDLSGSLLYKDMQRALKLNKRIITPIYTSVISRREMFAFVFPSGTGALIAEVDVDKLFEIINETGLLALYEDAFVLIKKNGSDGIMFSSDRVKYPFWAFTPTGDNKEIRLNGTLYYFERHRLKDLGIELIVLTPEKYYSEYFSILVRYFTGLIVLILIFFIIRNILFNRWFYSPLFNFLDGIKNNLMSAVKMNSPYSEWKTFESVYNNVIEKTNEFSGRLEKSEQKFRLLAENSKDMIFRQSLINGRYEYVSPASEEITGYKPEELYNTPNFIKTIVHPQWQDYYTQEWDKIQRGILLPYYEYQVVHRSGSLKWIYQRNVIVFDDNENPVSIEGVITDITDRRRAEEQLRQAQKMEIVGNLAGGLAHDFNNLLGGIMGILSLLKHKLARNTLDSEKMFYFFGLMEESGNRAAAMVKQLFTISRKQDISVTRVDLNDVIKQVIKICETTLDKSINLFPRYSDKPAFVLADSMQLEQVLLNLCVNAAHAMTIMREPGISWGGTLSVSLEKIHADKYFRKSHTEAEDKNYWMLIVRDTGTGIDTEIVEKIFNPFFSTKEKEKGTGLGLSMAYNIIKQHNGFITVYSDPGTGSTFNIFLPEFTEEKNQQDEKKIVTQPPSGEGLILVVDDEDVIRIAAKEILEDCGYEVILGKNGREGVEIFSMNHEKIRAVLLDMSMPESSGRDAYKKMKEINPDVRVLLASGFRYDERVDEVMTLGVNAFIQKPFTLDSLAHAIHNVIYG